MKRVAGFLLLSSGLVALGLVAFACWAHHTFTVGISVPRIATLGIFGAATFFCGIWLLKSGVRLSDLGR
jgi:hypothetical protein